MDFWNRVKNTADKAWDKTKDVASDASKAASDLSERAAKQVKRWRRNKTELLEGMSAISMVALVADGRQSTYDDTGEDVERSVAIKALTFHGTFKDLFEEDEIGTAMDEALDLAIEAFVNNQQWAIQTLDDRVAHMFESLSEEDCNDLLDFAQRLFHDIVAASDDAITTAEREMADVVFGEWLGVDAETVASYYENDEIVPDEQFD